MTYIPLQIQYGDNPKTKEIDGWRVLVISILLNRTSRKQVEQVLSPFFNMFPHAAFAEVARYSVKYHELMQNIVAPLGFGHTRSTKIARLSEEWLDHKDWRRAECVTRFTGCGEYAADAWKIFVDRDYSKPAFDLALEQWRRTRAMALARSAI